MYNIQIYIQIKRLYSPKIVYSIFKNNMCVSAEQISGVPTDLLCPHNPFLGSQQIYCVHIITF